MNATWAVRRHVSRALELALLRRWGALEAWAIVRRVWLSGALGDRQPVSLGRVDLRSVTPQVPLWHWDEN